MGAEMLKMTVGNKKPFKQLGSDIIDQVKMQEPTSSDSAHQYKHMKGPG
jgi:hypothetical protein